MTGPILLCTDSSALLPPQLAVRLDVDVVPVGISLDGEPFDEAGADVDRFYDLLRRGARATTSQPSPGSFAEAYARAAGRGAREVLSIHLAGTLSGTVGAAELAARDAPIPVTVVDTGTVSFGVGVCVIAAAESLARGASVGEAVDAVERLGPTLRNAFVVGRAARGRVPETADIALLAYVGSSAETLGASESLEDAAEQIASRVLAADGRISAAVGHADRATEASADALAGTLADRSKVVEVMRYRVGPSVGAHTGPVCFGAFWWAAPGAEA